MSTSSFSFLLSLSTIGIFAQTMRESLSFTEYLRRVYWTLLDVYYECVYMCRHGKNEIYNAADHPAVLFCGHKFQISFFIKKLLT